MNIERLLQSKWPLLLYSQTVFPETLLGILLELTKTNKWMDRWVDSMDKWMNGWMDGWKSEWMNKQWEWSNREESEMLYIVNPNIRMQDYKQCRSLNPSPQTFSSLGFLTPPSPGSCFTSLLAPSQGAEEEELEEIRVHRQRRTRDQSRRDWDGASSEVGDSLSPIDHKRFHITLELFQVSEDIIYFFITLKLRS